MTNGIEHSGVVDLGDGTVKSCPFCGAEARVWYDDVTLAACSQEDCPGYEANALIVDWNCRVLARSAQEPVAVPDGWQLVPIEPTEAILDVYWKQAGESTEMRSRYHHYARGYYSTPLYAAPQPVINPTHSQVAGTHGLLTDPTPVSEIIAKLREDMNASPVEDVTVIDRGQLEALSAALTPSPQDHVLPEDACPACGGSGHYGDAARRAIDGLEPVSDMGEAKQMFTDYFVKNYPGPDTIIFDPKWHGPRLFEAAMRCVRSAASEGSADAN